MCSCSGGLAVRHGAVDGPSLALVFQSARFVSSGSGSGSGSVVSEPLSVFPHHGQMHALKSGNGAHRLAPDYHPVSIQLI